MKCCDLLSGAAKLRRSTAQLHKQWATAKEHWRDKTSSDFEEAHIEPIAPLATMTVAAVQKMAEVFQEAERECLDENENDFF